MDRKGAEIWAKQFEAFDDGLNILYIDAGVRGNMNQNHSAFRSVFFVPGRQFTPFRQAPCGLSRYAPLKLFGQERIADILSRWTEEDKFSRILEHAELQKNDFNISPSRYIHTGDAETYRPIAEIVAELEAIEAEARETDAE
jgi:hypothetical protein